LLLHEKTEPKIQEAAEIINDLGNVVEKFHFSGIQGAPVSI
jgi:hypothetical protein